MLPPEVGAGQRAAAGLTPAGVAGAPRGDAPPLQHRHRVPALPVQREQLAVKTNVPQAACRRRGKVWFDTCVYYMAFKIQRVYAHRLQCRHDNETLLT